MWYTIRGAGGRWPGGGTGFEMSFVVVAPEWVSAAATDVANIGSAISQANIDTPGLSSGRKEALQHELSTVEPILHKTGTNKEHA
jgi:hypothetical protein